jgi:hypothetical protein
MKTDVDILFANEEEAKALFEVETFNAALKAAKAWHGLAAMTRSEHGCVIAAPDGEVHVVPASAWRRSWTPRAPATSSPRDSLRRVAQSRPADGSTDWGGGGGG